ncbi:hypothetical protein ACFLXI_05545 [Chloroflexota bacterium]
MLLPERLRFNFGMKISSEHRSANHHMAYATNPLNQANPIHGVSTHSTENLSPCDRATTGCSTFPNPGNVAHGYSQEATGQLPAGRLPEIRTLQAGTCQPKKIPPGVSPVPFGTPSPFPCPSPRGAHGTRLKSCPEQRQRIEGVRAALSRILQQVQDAESGRLAPYQLNNHTSLTGVIVSRLFLRPSERPLNQQTAPLC